MSKKLLQQQAQLLPLAQASFPLVQAADHPAFKTST
jgi:hypothetical protein